MKSLIEQPMSEATAVEALAELNTALAELEATNEELLRSNTALAEITQARDLEARRYRELFERIPIASIVTDEWGVIEDANAAAEEMLNVSRARLQGKPISVFVPPEKRREFRERLNKIPLSEVWEVSFQPRERERLAVQLDVAVMPSAPGVNQRLCWVIQNITPQRAAASTEKLLAREVTLRMEAQATVTRLRALHVGLEQLEHDVKVSIPQRVTSLLETLVPRFAHSISCQFPGANEPAIELGQTVVTEHVLDAPIHAPQRPHGRLVARRPSRFTPEDSAILLSAANAITALLCSAYNARNGEATR
jgi:PAS domain S-box-containing protein